jgi:hypothetical protein
MSDDAVPVPVERWDGDLAYLMNPGRRPASMATGTAIDELHGGAPLGGWIRANRILALSTGDPGPPARPATPWPTRVNECYGSKDLQQVQDTGARYRRLKTYVVYDGQMPIGYLQELRPQRWTQGLALASVFGRAQKFGHCTGSSSRDQADAGRVQREHQTVP